MANQTHRRTATIVPTIPVIAALVGLVVGGVFLLHRADAQARDTIRKHHLEDIEQALYFARGLNGTYPPYDQPTWCGVLQDPANAAVREQVEAALRRQNDKYENPDKPFPQDPLTEQDMGLVQPPSLPQQSGAGYFYWKRSPAVFELYSILETDPTGDRDTRGCTSATPQEFDYGLNSRTRSVSLHP